MSDVLRTCCRATAGTNDDISTTKVPVASCHSSVLRSIKTDTVPYVTVHGNGRKTRFGRFIKTPERLGYK